MRVMLEPVRDREAFYVSHVGNQADTRSILCGLCYVPVRHWEAFDVAYVGNQLYNVNVTKSGIGNIDFYKYYLKSISVYCNMYS